MSKEKTIWNTDGKEIIKNVEKKKTKKEKLKDAIDKWVLNNDEDSYKVIFEHYYPKLINYAAFTFFNNDRNEAEDCIIEGFAQVHEKTKKYYKPQGFQFQTWMYTVCKNVCLNKLKKKAKTGEINIDISDIAPSMWTKNTRLADMTETINDNFGEFDITSGAFPEEPMTKDVIWQKTYDTSLGLINELDPMTANLIIEKFLNKAKIKDLAAKYNVGESYIKNHIYNGLKYVQKRFKERYSELYDSYVDVNSEFETYFEA